MKQKCFWQLNCVVRLNWIVWNRTDYLYKNGIGFYVISTPCWYDIKPKQLNHLIQMSRRRRNKIKNQNFRFNKFKRNWMLIAFSFAILPESFISHLILFLIEIFLLYLSLSFFSLCSIQSLLCILSSFYILYSIFI